MPKISVVVAHHKGLLIERCLESLKDKSLEVIVITSDLSYKTKYKIILKKTTINNPSLKRNLGSEIATSDYLVFMDDDVEVTQHCIRRMSDLLDKEPKIGMVYATLMKMDDHTKFDTSGSFLTWCGFLHETYEKRKELFTKVLAGKSACCMIRKNLFYDVGKFDKDFVIYAEETDLSWRVWNYGYQVVVRNDAIAYHAFETKLKPENYHNKYFIYYHGCKNYITMLLKNLPPYKLYIALLNALVWFTMACFIALKNRKASSWIFQGLWYNIKNFRYIWKKRRYRVWGDYYPDITKNPPLFYYLNRFKEYLRQGHHG